MKLLNDTDETSRRFGRSMTLLEFLNLYGDSIKAKVGKEVPPVFDDTKKMPQNWVDIVSEIPITLESYQLKAIFTAVSGNLQHFKKMFLDGECGTGKTCVSIIYSYLLYRLGKINTVLIVVPPHLVEKWKREINFFVGFSGAVIVDASGHSALENLSNLKHSGKHGKLTYVITTSTRIRDGEIYRPAFSVRKGLFSCSSCGDFIREGNISTSLFRFLKSAVLKQHSECFDTKGNLINISEEQNDRNISFWSKTFCPICNEALFQYKTFYNSEMNLETKVIARLKKMKIRSDLMDNLIDILGINEIDRRMNKSIHGFIKFLQKTGYLSIELNQEELQSIIENETGKARLWPLSYYITKQMRKFFDLCIVDECHEYGTDSGRGYAARKISASCKYVLAMSATLFNGYADNNDKLLALIDPRQNGPYKMNFKEYGGHKLRKHQNGIVQKSKYPSLSPHLPLFFAEHSIMMRYIDADKKMPELYQKMIEIPLSAPMKEVYERLIYWGNYTNKNTFFSKVNNMSIDQARATYLSTCWMEFDIRDDAGNTSLLLPQIYDMNETPKEEKIIELVNEALYNDEKVLIYSPYVNKRPQLKRLETVLKRRHISCSVLDQKTATAKNRERYLQEQVKKTDVLITNPELVKTGLDLIEYTTIIFADIPVNSCTIMQALYRSKRLIQENDVKVYYLTYTGCQEYDKTKSTAEKIKAMFSFGGTPPEELRSYF